MLLIVSYKSFHKSSLSYTPTFALSDLWLRPYPWFMAVCGVEWRRGSGMVFYGGEEARLDQGSIPGGEAFTAPSSPVISGRWRLFLLRRRRFYLREGEAYLAPSSPSCPRRVEATVAPHCRFGTRRKFGWCGESSIRVLFLSARVETRKFGWDLRRWWSYPSMIPPTIEVSWGCGVRRVGGPDESAVCPMTLSLEDHWEGRCFVAGYEIRWNEARLCGSDGV